MVVMEVNLIIVILQEAIRLVTRVLELQPNCSQALVARAKCYEQCGDLQAAVRDVTTALNIRPGDRNIQAWRININIKLQAQSSLVSDDKSDKSQDSSSGVSSTADTNTATMTSHPGQ